MAVTNDRRELLRRARTRLDGWRYVARTRAYGELFEGETAALTDDEVRQLDEIDSRLTRSAGEGLWNVDEYGIVENGANGNGSGFRVVCIAHPEIPYEGYRGTWSLDEATRGQFNDVLWEYCQLVADYVQEELDAFVDRGGRDDERR